MAPSGSARTAGLRPSISQRWTRPSAREFLFCGSGRGRKNRFVQVPFSQNVIIFSRNRLNSPLPNVNAGTTSRPTAPQRLMDCSRPQLKFEKTWRRFIKVMLNFMPAPQIAGALKMATKSETLGDGVIGPNHDTGRRLSRGEPQWNIPDKKICFNRFKRARLNAGHRSIQAVWEYVLQTRQPDRCYLPEPGDHRLRDWEGGAGHQASRV